MLLLEHCGPSNNTKDTGPIFAYTAPFEKRVLKDFITAFPVEAIDLTNILERIEDLLPIARKHYYHPSQHGSWSIKAVLPAICPDLSYTDLEVVQDGMMAQQSYLEAIAPITPSERREEIRKQLLAYCLLDTLGLVKMWQFFRKK